MKYRNLVAVALLISSLPGSGSATVLIAASEARPPPADVYLRSTPHRDPGVKLEEPPPKLVSSPFNFNVAFVPHGKTEIDVGTLVAVYLNNPQVDLTSRLRQFTSGTGVRMDHAEAPPGRHLILLEIRDNKGGLTRKLIDLSVKKQ
jgi:hypothetical protein